MVAYVKVSSIIDQINNESVLIEATPTAPYGDNTMQVYALFFQKQADYEGNRVTGWFYIRVYTTPGKEGYNIPSNQHVWLERDVPLVLMWDALKEYISLLKMSDDKMVSNGNGLGIFPYRITMQHSFWYAPDIPDDGHTLLDDGKVLMTSLGFERLNRGY